MEVNATFQCEICGEGNLSVTGVEAHVQRHRRNYDPDWHLELAQGSLEGAMICWDFIERYHPRAPQALESAFNAAGHLERAYLQLAQALAALVRCTGMRAPRRLPQVPS